jgi:hypothetical protein
MKHNAKGIANALKVAPVPKSISPEKAMTLVLRLARGHGRGNPFGRLVSYRGHPGDRHRWLRSGRYGGPQ